MSELANNYNKNNKYGEKRSEVYKVSHAPYNFVPFSDKVCTIKDSEMTSHSDMSDELYSGEILYSIVSKTPIFVWDGVKDDKDEIEYFYKNAEGTPAIPGSTVRGLIRSNAQILGLASMGDDIDDYSLMYRSVGTKGNDPNKKIYNLTLGNKPKTLDNKSISILTKVKAGYIREKNGKYEIIPTTINSIGESYEEMNYYVIREGLVQDSQLYNSEDFKRIYIQKSKPFAEKISYELRGNKVISIAKYEEKSLKGYLVRTGNVPKKKVLYVIPEIEEKGNPIKISEKELKDFKIDYENKVNQLVDKSFYNLPKEGETKPVFYVNDNGHLYFGFTPRLRLFYDNTISAGIPDNHKTEQIDLIKSIFGFSKGAGYKSKVHFMDAKLVNDKKSMNKTDVILGTPKASSYNDYLYPRENGNASSYNTKGFKLRGVKQYWLRNNTFSNMSDKVNVSTSFKPLPEESKFDGRIRFNNLKKHELGLLLWAIRLEKDSHMNIGKAKSLGFGNIVVTVNGLNLWDNQKAYSVDNIANTADINSILDFSPLKSVEKDEYIDYYKDFIQKKMDIKNIMDVDSIKTFFVMKNGNQLPDERLIGYMELGEYQGRYPLPDVEAVMRASKEGEKALTKENAVSTKSNSIVASNKNKTTETSVKEEKRNIAQPASIIEPGHTIEDGRFNFFDHNKRFGYITTNSNRQIHVVLSAIENYSSSINYQHKKVRVEYIRDEERSVAGKVKYEAVKCKVM